MNETSEKLDHTLRAYGRLERKHGERGRELTAVEAERDAYKALVIRAQRLVGFAEDVPRHELEARQWADDARSALGDDVG